MKWKQMRVSAATHKALNEVSKRTGVKLWFAAQSAAVKLLATVKANGK